MLDAARKITGLGVGALPIRGSDERFKGVPTDHKVRRLPVIAGHILIGWLRECQRHARGSEVRPALTLAGLL
ncbi:hypothetical protein ABZT43_34345 [Streptomyces sp. NPDC005349]|uniref:hypothetical protein n=1 Tax=Streptomyces sp. NPDC005349 TaxID=3157037 RepID=UPI0033ABF637